MNFSLTQPSLFILFILITGACGNKKENPSKEIISELNLKRGTVITCGPPNQQFGSLEFQLAGNEELKQDFNLAVKLLHSFEYDEAEKVFAKIIDQQPTCAMAYWGVAMSNFHPLWTPPTEAELKKGAKAIQVAKDITAKSAREADYIDALASFYMSWDKLDHRTRTLQFETAMERLYALYPRDNEAAIFYSLALNAAADPADKSFKRQKKAAAILNTIYPGQPDHPGIIHYFIHTYDFPELAELALPAARKYASVAPSSAHALHMPSHIFTRLGLWDESINSNLESVDAAKCYAASAGMKGHWDEELHGLDYLVYAYLQKGENELAKKQLDYLKTIDTVEPLNFKVAYAFASIPARYVLENKSWKEAAQLKAHKESFPWEKFQWQKAIIHFTRLMGSAHTGDIPAARVELAELNRIHNNLLAEKNTYTANQVQVQLKSGEAWIRFKEGKNEEALALMMMAADLEDKTEKHPVTPGEVIPARELLADLLLQMNKPAEAFDVYVADLKKHPGRFNGLYGAGLAAERSGNSEKAGVYYRQLLDMVNVNSKRVELIAVKKYLNEHK